MHWRERWEYEALQERETLQALDEDTLLDRVRHKSANLDRYHCAGALFQILGMPDPASKSDLRPRVQWDYNGEDARQQALLELEQIILEKTRT